MVKQKYIEVINREFDSFTRIWLNKQYLYQHYLMTSAVKDLAIEDPDINSQDFDYICAHIKQKEAEYDALVNSTKTEE